MLETFVLQDSALMQPGFIHRPDQPNGIAVIIVNALHWDSVGPGRSMVEVCNRLAGIGITAIRYEPAYDWIGAADANAVSRQEIVFRSLQQVVAFTQTNLGMQRIHVLGYCLGAQYAFLNTAVHPALASLILVEIDIGMKVTAPNLLSEHTPASAQHIEPDRRKRFRIYLRKMLLPETWVKAISLRIDWRGVLNYLFDRRGRSKQATGAERRSPDCIVDSGISSISPATLRRGPLRNAVVPTEGEAEGQLPGLTMTTVTEHSPRESMDAEVERVSEMVRTHVGRCPAPILYFHNPFAAHEEKVRRMHKTIFRDCKVTYVDCTTIWGSLKWVDEIAPRILDWCMRT
jgi:hypothetical protein